MASIVIFHYYLVSWCKLQIHAAGGPSDFMLCYLCIHRISNKKMSTHRNQYGSIEIFWPLGHVLVWAYGNILSPGVNFESKKVMNYFKSLYQIDLNILKHFEQKNQTIKFVNKMFQYLHIVYYWHAPLQPLSKNRFYFFFSSSDKQIFHHLLGCCSIGIYSAL